MNKGYRDHTIFNDGYTDPLEVCYYETSVLGNVDIPQMILKNGKLDEKQRQYLEEIVNYEHDEIDKWYFNEIIRSYIGDRNYCLWLCKCPEDVYNSYIKPYSSNAGITYEAYRERITEYDIPEDAVVLSDGGVQGALYCWKTS